MRDPRRRFTVRQARYLHERAQGHCEECGRELPKDWEAHHVEPHGLGGQTVVWNGRALCPPCHREIHMGSGGRFEPRQWQVECFKTFEEVVLEQGEPNFVLEACPGAGKSAMAAMMADALLNDDRFQELYGVEHVVALVPWSSIQGSVAGPGGSAGMCKAFADRGLCVRDYLLANNIRVSQPKPSAFDASIITYQSAINPDVFKAIRLWREQAGIWRFALILDEIHHTRATGGTWGEAVEQLKAEASFSICMSGTYFRSDCHPIQFLRYECGQPVANFRYTYRQALIDQCVRPVSFRYNDPTFDLYDTDSRKTIREKIKLSCVIGREQTAAAQRTVLDVNESDCIANMIREAHGDLMRKRQKFPDAGCLVVCRPGQGDATGEDRHVQQVASLVAKITGIQPVVLTHHDGDEITRDKLADFRSGTVPYLVAVNMVSEGCDIPRLRSIVFCRYTESEMLFRQIVGRALRVTTGDDGTAAEVYIPTFPLMETFARNLEGDCQQVLKEFGCVTCGAYPCVCSCSKCGQPKSSCDCNGEKTGSSAPPRLVAVNVASQPSGGAIGGERVEEAFVQVAEELATSQPSFAHSNKVQLGQAMQFWASRNGEQPIAVVAVSEPDREHVAQRINRVIKRLAALLYSELGKDKRNPHAFNKEFRDVFGLPFREAKVQWSTTRLEEAAERLEKRYASEARSRRG